MSAKSKDFCARWFLDHKVNVFPIKSRDKVPACPSWDDYAATKDEVTRWSNYGVALGFTFGVVDSDTPEVEAWVAAQVAARHIPVTPLMVRTARGIHRYYRLGGAAPHFIHRAGFTIEFRNVGQYVVGPGSVHSTGHVYAVADWSWTLEDVPFFPRETFQWEDRPEGERGSADGQALVIPPVIKAGERHDVLFKLMRSLQAHGIDDAEQLLTVLRAENRAKCVPPVDDGELTKYIRRVARYKDKPNFTRTDVADGETLAGILIDQGASIEAAIAAAKAVDTTFDPSGSSPAPAAKKKALEQEIERLEGQIAYAKAHANDPPLEEIQDTSQPTIAEVEDEDIVEFDEDGLEIVDESELTGGDDE